MRDYKDRAVFQENGINIVVNHTVVHRHSMHPDERSVKTIEVTLSGSTVVRQRPVSTSSLHLPTGEFALRRPTRDRSMYGNVSGGLERNA
jgi:hypothetical protein